MGTATKKRPSKANTQPAPIKEPKKITKPILAYAIVKSPAGENLWQLLTYHIQDDVIVKVERSVEDLREILVSKVPDLVGGLQ